jgi:hypothetical protein
VIVLEWTCPAKTERRREPLGTRVKRVLGNLGDRAGGEGEPNND